MERILILVICLIICPIALTLLEISLAPTILKRFSFQKKYSRTLIYALGAVLMRSLGYWIIISNPHIIYTPTTWAGIGVILATGFLHMHLQGKLEGGSNV